MFKKISELLFTFLFFVFLVFCTGVIIHAYVDDYNLTNAKMSEATIVAKSADKGLFLPPAYFVKVNHGGNVNDRFSEGYGNRISKRQMKNLDIGDKISGFTTNDRDFSTIRDFLFDSAIYLIAISVFGLIAFCILLVLIGDIKVVDQFLDRLDRKSRKRKKKRKRKKWGGKVFLVVLTCFLAHFSLLYLSNLFHKVVPIGQTKTEAVIADKKADITYRRHTDSSYEFILVYDVGSEEIRTVKEVTEHTYQNHHKLQRIPITYRNSDPYDIFISGTNLADFINALLYRELLIYILFIAGLIGLGYYYIWKGWWKRSVRRRRS